MVCGGKLAPGHTQGAHNQECGADQHVQTVEARSCVEGSPVVTVRHCQRSLIVLKRLFAGGSYFVS